MILRRRPTLPAPAPPQENAMKKLLRCSDVIPGCDFVAHGVNENEIIIRATQHAREVHSVTWLTPDLFKRVIAAIRDEEVVITEG
jgi:predicted small metal-binding protein